MGLVLVGFVWVWFFFLGKNPVALGVMEKEKMHVLFNFPVDFCFLCQMLPNTSCEWHQLHTGALPANPLVITLCVMNPPSPSVALPCFSFLLFCQISLVISVADIWMLRISKQPTAAISHLSRCAGTTGPARCSSVLHLICWHTAKLSS